MVFLITVLGFVPFAFDQNGPQFRCQVTCLLLIASVNFRWTLTQRLPSLGYLTSLDKYAIGSLFTLTLLCCWHALIGSNAITSDISYKRQIDSGVLYASACLFTIYNLIFMFWFIKKLIRIRQTFSKKTSANEETQNVFGLMQRVERLIKTKF